MNLPILFEPYLASIQDELFGADFTKAVSSKDLWEAGCLIGVLELDGGKEVAEEAAEIVGLDSFLRRALDKIQKNVF